MNEDREARGTRGTPAPRPDPRPAGRHGQVVARLRRIASGRDPQRTVVDGWKLVAEAFAAGIDVVEMVVARDGLAALDRLDPPAGWPAVHVVEREVFDALAPSQHPQGVLAVVAVPTAVVTARGVVVYLDRVQDPGNVGTLVRTAAAFHAAGVACSPGCGDPFSPRAIRASAGWSLRLPVQRGVVFAPLAAAVVAAGGTVVAATGDGGTDLGSWRPCLPLLLAMGNEGQGLAADVVSGCTERVTIPMRRGVESLNVAVAAGVILAALGGRGASPILDGEEHGGRQR